MRLAGQQLKHAGCWTVQRQAMNNSDMCHRLEHLATEPCYVKQCPSSDGSNFFGIGDASHHRARRVRLSAEAAAHCLDGSAGPRFSDLKRGSPSSAWGAPDGAGQTFHPD